MHRVVAQLRRRLATQGTSSAARKRHAHVDVRRTMRASLRDRRRAGRLQVPPAPPAAPGDLRALRRLDERHQRVRLLPLASCTRCTTRSARCARSSSSSASPRSPTSSSKERDFKAVSEAIGRDAGVADISGYTDYGRVWNEFRDARRGRPAPARDGDRARRRAHQRPRPARRRLRADRRAGRPHVLAEPRAAPVLELRRLGDLRLRAATARPSSAGPPSSSRTSSRR